MAQTRTLARSFAGGEVTPEFWGRIDDGKYQTGLALSRNFYSLPHGPVVNRPGTTFVRASKDSTKKSVVRPFAYSITQTMVLEFGDSYVRFHTQGATLARGVVAAYNGATAYTPGDLAKQGGVDYVCIANTTGNAPPNAAYWYAQPATGEYEIPSPYAQADLLDLHFEQSLDVLTITHTGYQPRELRRAGAVKWYFTTPAFTPTYAAPTGVGVVATQPTAGTTKSRSYVVTALTGTDESLPSSVVSVANLLTGIGNFNTVSWSAVAGATRYNVYALEGGIYGFIGQSSTLTFVDDNIAADTSYCPPENVNPFPAASPGDYPAAVTYFEQRRCFAGTLNKPQNFWATRSGTESNLQYAIPTRDDDSLQFKIAARQNQTIRHLVPMQDLLVFTASAEWRIRSSDGGPLTPTNFSVKPQSYVGANNVTPLAFNTTVVFFANRGGHVREMGYSNEAGGWITGDLSLRTPHRFDGYSILDAAVSKAPYPIAWLVSSAGNLLSLTYVPEQNVGAWASHDTDGTFESVCCVAEGAEDVLYAVVNRTIGGVTKRYIERMATRRFATQADAFFVDAGLSYSGASTSTLAGLDHLEGKTVAILADGAVRPTAVVTGGQITLDAPCTKAQVGLPITADLQLLPMAVEAQAFGQGRTKNVNRVWMRVYQSLGIRAGPSLTRLTEYAARTTEVFGSPPNLQTKECEIVLDPEWTDGGQVYVRQSDPLPLTLVSMILEAEVGG
jgi:hypothetical protein